MKPHPRPPVIPKDDSADRAAPRTPASTAKASVAGNASKSSAGEVRKLTIRMAEEDIGRARSAWRLACAHRPDYPSFGQWVAELIVAATEQVEAETGSPIEPTPAGVIPTGAAAR